MTGKRRRRVGRWLLLGLGFALLLHLAALAFLATHQERLVYHPVRAVTRTPAELGLTYEDVWIATRDGPTLHGFYVHARRPPRGVVLYCHGNAGNVGHRVEIAGLLADLGVDVLLFDYRGFGRSTGRTSEAGTYEDAEAAYGYLVHERGARPEGIVIFGRSLGGPIAARTAARRRAAGLVLDSTFTSIPDLVLDTWPRVLVVRRAIAFRYDTASFLSRVDEPVLVLHSPEDTLVPFEHGKRLAARVPGAVFAPTAGGHGLGPLDHRDAWVPPVAAFLDRVLPRAVPSHAPSPPPGPRPP